MKTEKFVILARLEAKPDKEKEVLAFLKSALPLAKEGRCASKSVGLFSSTILNSGYFPLNKFS